MIQLSTPVRVNKHTIEHFPQNANFDLPGIYQLGSLLTNLKNAKKINVINREFNVFDVEYGVSFICETEFLML